MKCYKVPYTGGEVGTLNEALAAYIKQPSSYYENPAGVLENLVEVVGAIVDLLSTRDQEYLAKQFDIKEE